LKLDNKQIPLRGKVKLSKDRVGVESTFEL